MNAFTPALKNRFSPQLTVKNNFAQLVATHAQLSSLSAQNDEPSPIDQQLADAFNANNDVMAYVIGISGTTLPVLPNAPAWYAEFKTAFTNIQINANAWYSIATNLVSIPNSISAFGLAFGASMTTINALLNILKVDSKNTAAINGIKQQLSGLVKQLNQYAGVASNFKSSIDNFNTSLTADAATMSQAVKDSLDTQGANKQQVDQLLKDIDSLKAEIKTWQTVITASAIGAGVGFFAGAVIGIFSLGFGLAFGIISAAAGIATMIAANAKVNQLNGKILQDQANMDALNQQISALAALNTQLEELINLSKAAGVQIELILQVWEELQAELNQVITDLETCEGDVAILNIAQLEYDLNTANSDWNELITLCNKIASISYAQATPVSANL